MKLRNCEIAREFGEIRWVNFSNSPHRSTISEISLVEKGSPGASFVLPGRTGRLTAVLVSGTRPQGNRQGARWQGRHTGRQVLLFGFLLVAAVGQLALGGRRRRGNVAILRRRYHAPQWPPVEHQHGRAALQPRITTLTLPVTVARFAQRHIAVGVIVAECCKQAVSYC